MLPNFGIPTQPQTAAIPLRSPGARLPSPRPAASAREPEAGTAGPPERRPRRDTIRPRPHLRGSRIQPRGAPGTARERDAHALAARPALALSNGLELPPPEVGGRAAGGAGCTVATAGCGRGGPRGSRFPLRAMAKAADVVRLLLGSTALCFSLLGARTASASKAVTAHLAAKWPETPLLLEARWVRAGRSLPSPARREGRRGCGLAGPCRSLGPRLAGGRPCSSLHGGSSRAGRRGITSSPATPCAALTCSSFPQPPLCLAHGFPNFGAFV